MGARRRRQPEVTPHPLHALFASTRVCFWGACSMGLGLGGARRRGGPGVRRRVYEAKDSYVYGDAVLVHFWVEYLVHLGVQRASQSGKVRSGGFCRRWKGMN